MLELDKELERMYGDMVEWRRYMHQYPELSYQEEKTSRFVMERLQGWGIETTALNEGYGIVARINGDHPGPTVALRADMDALPIQDQKTCKYASKVEGVMHACGHDAHTSTLLAAAKCLQERKNQLHGNVVCIFQPAEELNPGGALPMIKQGVLSGVDVIYGVHLWTPFPFGTVWSKAGPMMASADEFQIEITGKGGHGGLPHESIDSIVIASQLVLHLQTIASRLVDPTEPCVVSVGSIHGGTVFNAIAETCRMSGTVRTFKEDIRDGIIERMQKMVDDTCSMYDAEAKFTYKKGYPPVVNDTLEVLRFNATAPQIVGDQGTQACPLIMAGEDFAYYLHHVPGCFMFVGAGLGEAAKVPHHHPRFDIEEKSMLVAGTLLIKMAESYLAEAHEKAGNPHC